MKKKLLSFIFAVALILPCACLLSACKDENNATVTGIKYELANSNYTYVDNALQFTFGESINLTKSDFRVSLIYSDNTTTQISDYSLNLPIAFSSPIIPIGEYEIKFVYNKNNDISATLTVKIVSQQITAPTFSSTSAEIVTTYSNSLQDVTSFISTDSNNEQIALLKTLLDSNLVTLVTNSNDPNSTLTATDAGEYYFDIKLNNPNFVWNTGGNQSTTIRVNWKIDKMTITTPTVDIDDKILAFAHTYNPATQKYEANTRSLNINFGDFLPEEISEMFVNHNNTGKDAGKYTCTISLSENAKKNYQFLEKIDENITDSSLTIDWEIEKMEITPPSLSVNEFSYTGESILPTISNLADYIDIENPISPINVGEYNYNVTIISSMFEDLDNYSWAGMENLDEFTLSYSIIRSDYSAPNDIAENIEFEIDYSANLTLDDIVLPNANSTNSDVNLTAESLKYLQDNGLFNISSNESVIDEEHSYYFSWKENGETLLGDSGEKTFTLIYYFDYSNYNPIEISVTVNVNQVGIKINPTWDIESSATYDEDGYSNKIELNLPSDNQLISAPIISYKNYYKANETDDYTEITTTPTNVGFYKTVANISIDKNFYLYSQDNSNEVITNIEIEWQIVKQEITITSNWTGTESSKYDGENREISFVVDNDLITNISYTHEFKAEGSDTFVTVKNNELTEIGKYKTTVTFEYDTQNYKLIIDGNISNSVNITWYILSPSIDCSSISWSESENTELTFSNSHISPTLNVPENVIVSYSYKNANGTNINSTIDVGTYTVIATIQAEDGFSLSNANESYTLTYSIIPRTLTASDFSWNYSSPFTYDGEEKTVELINNYEDYVEITYDGNSSSEVGNHSATAYITLIDDTNLTIEDTIELTLDWEIISGTPISKVTIEENEYSYDEFLALEYLPMGSSISFSVNTGYEVELNYSTTNETTISISDYAEFNFVAKYKNGAEIIKKEFPILITTVKINNSPYTLIFNETIVFEKAINISEIKLEFEQDFVDTYSNLISYNLGENKINLTTEISLSSNISNFSLCYTNDTKNSCLSIINFLDATHINSVSIRYYDFISTTSPTKILERLNSDYDYEINSTSCIITNITTTLKDEYSNYSVKILTQNEEEFDYATFENTILTIIVLDGNNNVVETQYLNLTYNFELSNNNNKISYNSLLDSYYLLTQDEECSLIVKTENEENNNISVKINNKSSITLSESGISKYSLTITFKIDSIEYVYNSQIVVNYSYSATDYFDSLRIYSENTYEISQNENVFEQKLTYEEWQTFSIENFEYEIDSDNYEIVDEITLNCSNEINYISLIIKDMATDETFSISLIIVCDNFE